MAKPKSPKVPAFQFSEHPNVADYDWRYAVATTLKEPFQGRKFHPAGTPVVAACPVEYDANTQLNFTLPSASALLLDHSHRMWLESRDAISSFTVNEPEGRMGPADYDALVLLLERRMTAVVFAYSAIEAFANEMLENAYSQHGYIYSDPTTGDPVTLENIERHSSLESKLCVMLPAVGKVKSPKGSVHWQHFGHLRKMRHFIIHPKLENRIVISPKAKLLWKMLVEASFRDFASDAHALMLHYDQHGAYGGRWLHKCPF